jgi:hypothetical protein
MSQYEKDEVRMRVNKGEKRERETNRKRERELGWPLNDSHAKPNSIIILFIKSVDTICIQVTSIIR